MNSIPDISALAAIVGQEHVYTSVDEKIKASTPYRDGEGQTDYLGIVDPADANEISKIVDYCRTHRVAITPQAGLTSLTKASIPTPRYVEPRPQIILRLRRMQAMEELIYDDDGNITAVRTQPGITLQKLNEKLSPFGVIVPIGLGIGYQAQLGGIVSTNAGGTEAAFKGRPDKLVLALDVVTADGKQWHLPSSEPNAPTLADFIGQEGTMGIITNIVIAVHPIPIQRKVIFVETDTFANMYDLFAEAKKIANPYLNAFERIDTNILILLCKYFDKPDPFLNRRKKNALLGKYNFIIELNSNDASVDLTKLAHSLVEQALAKNLIQTAWIAEDETQANDIWSYRIVKLSETLKRRANNIEGRTVAFDIGLPEGDQNPFPSEALEKKLQDIIPQVEIYGFGHAAGGGQGGTLLHFDLVIPKNVKHGQIQGLKAAVYDEISLRHGTIAAEHGIGFYKQADFKKYNQTAYKERISRKKRLDPENIFNPGKVIAKDDLT